MKSSQLSPRTKTRRLPGCTLDCGALVALERREARALALVDEARRDERRVTVPAAVLAEWWRDDPRQRYLRSLFTVEDTTEDIARRAGVALGSLPGHRSSQRASKRTVSAVDAIVMASAATRSEIVYTSDASDLERLLASFPNVAVVQL